MPVLTAAFCGQEFCPRELQEFMDPCSKSSTMHVPECHAIFYGLSCIMYVPQYCARFYDSVFMCTGILYKILWTHVVGMSEGIMHDFADSVCMQSIVQDFADRISGKILQTLYVSRISSKILQTVYVSRISGKIL